MKLTIPIDQIVRLKAALKKSGSREIGGQVFGQQLAPSRFRASDFTLQKRLGTIARFFVDLLQAAADAIVFFDRTKHNYSQFNYIGEWHSHPSFDVQPSHVDIQTMRDLVTDNSFKGQFAILLICKIKDDTIELGGWLFDPSGSEFAITIEEEHV